MIAKSNTLLVIVLIFSVGNCSFLKKAESKLSTEEIVLQNATQAFCFLNKNGTVYDLNPLYNSKSDYVIQGADYVVNFNICKKALGQCGDKDSMINWRRNSNIPNVAAEKQCISLTGADSVVSKWLFLNDTDTNETAVRIIMPAGDECRTDRTKNYTTIIEVACNPSIDSAILENAAGFNINSCSNTIRMQSKYACPKYNVYSFWNSIIHNRYIFGIILVIAGAFFCFLGKKFLRVTEILCGVLLVTFLIVYLLFAHLHIQYSSLEFWLIIVVAIIVGCFVGWLISKLEWLPPCILGGTLGYIGAMVLYQVMLKYIHSNPVAVYWVTLIVCVAIGATLGWFFAQHIIIIGTAFIGAYAFIRGISFMAGGFPDERQVIELIGKGEWTQVSAVKFYF